MKHRNQAQYLSTASLVVDPTSKKFDPRTASRWQRRLHGYTNAGVRPVFRGEPVITTLWRPASYGAEFARLARKMRKAGEAHNA